MLDNLMTGLALMASAESFIAIFIGLLAGIIIGAIPGLTADIAIILCLPITYSMDPIPAMLLLLGLYCGGTYGGSITAILINTPGTPSSAATVLDGYPLTQQGKPLKDWLEPGSARQYSTHSSLPTPAWTSWTTRTSLRSVAPSSRRSSNG